MSDITYSFVPTEFRGYTSKDEQVYKINPRQWTEIMITDSHDIYNHGGWREKMSLCFWVDKGNEVAKLLYELKGENEKLTIKKKLHKHSEKYETILIENIDMLVTTLDELDNKNFNDPFLYIHEGEVKKVLYITSGESIDLMIQNEYIDDVEKIVSRKADKVDFQDYYE